MVEIKYSVVQYTHNGTRMWAMSGMGRNKGTWGYLHSRRTAKKYAKELNKRYPNFDHRVEEN